MKTLTGEGAVNLANRISLPSETNVPFWWYNSDFLTLALLIEGLNLVGMAYNSVVRGPQCGLYDL